MDAKHADTSKRSAVRSSRFKWDWAIYPLLTFALIVVASASSQRAAKVEWRQEQLSVTAEKVPLSEVIQSVASKAGIAVVELEEFRQEISVQLADVPLHDGLQRLLADVNYVLIESASGQEQRRPVLTVILGGRVQSSSQKIIDCVLADAVDISKGFTEEDNETVLRRALDDPDPNSQALVLDLLVERDHENAVPVLVEGTQSSMPEVRLRAIDLLVSSQADDQTILSALGRGVNDEDRGIRSYAIRTLAQRGAPEGLAYLQAALVDPDPGTRILTLDNIFRFVPPAQGIPLLQAATLDSNEAVRSTASSLLAEATAARVRQRQ
jgi:HEAT repeat protein